MVYQAKKMAVLEKLREESSPLGLEALLAKMGGGYSERSVRRWLAEMVDEGVVEKLGNKRSTTYRALQPATELVQNSFSAESEEIIAKVRRPLYERSPIAYEDDWIDSYQPNKSYYLPQASRRELYRLGKRSKAEDPAGTYAHQIFNRLLIDLSYNSSRLEGNTYSLLDTQKLVLEGAGAEGKLDEEKVMILNHKEAIRYLVDHAPSVEINTQIIFTLHYLLSDGLVETKYAGKIRDRGVRIGGSTYIPFENPKHLKIRFDRIIKKAALIHDPFEQSFFLLVHITYLQAFTDVNKRTARLAANIPLIRSNLVPQSFNDVDKDDYISSVIAIYELQNVQPFLDLYIFSYKRTCAMYDSTVKAMGFDEVRVRYRAQRRALLREIILKKLSGKHMDALILAEAKKLSAQDQDSFIEDVHEDLKEMDLSRIAGLGVTPEELRAWLQKS